MEKMYSQIVGMPICEDDDPHPFAVVSDVVIDPETGKMIAVVVNTSKNLIISPLDILSINNTLHVSSRESVTEGQDILRVDAVQKSGKRIYRNKVYTKGKEYIGNVFDFTIDIKTYELKSIFVAKEFLGLLRLSTRIIPSKNIVQILPKKIVVESNIAKVIDGGQVSEVKMRNPALS